MRSYLNNAETQDAYTDEVTALFLPRRRVDIIVANAAVFAQFLRVRDDGQPIPGAWTEERFLIPAIYGMVDPAEGAPTGGVRLRSATAGTPARVSVAPT